VEGSNRWANALLCRGREELALELRLETVDLILGDLDHADVLKGGKGRGERREGEQEKVVRGRVQSHRLGREPSLGTPASYEKESFTSHTKQVAQNRFTQDMEINHRTSFPPVARGQKTSL
jgi:hypothetical protein